MKISVDVKGLESVKARLVGMGKQVDFATAVALTRTAKKAQAMMYDEFRAKLDRPTPTTMKSLFVDPAKRNKLEARVYLKDRAMGGKNPRSMSQIIGHHFAGGQRVAKSLEDLLRQNNYISAGEMVVPGAAAKLDRYGNMSRGQINQILSQLFVRRSGFDNTPTNSARSRNNVAKAGRIFWSYGQGGTKRPLVDKATGITYGYTGGKGNHLAKGAWVSVGRGVQPLLLVIGSASYRRRFDFDKTAQRAIDQHFDTEFSTALDNALRTAR